MKPIHTLALIAAGAVSITSTPLRAAEVDARVELSFNKSHPGQSHLSYDVIKIGEKASAQVNEQESVWFKKEVGNRSAPQTRPTAGAQPRTIYSSKNELKAEKPNNVVRSQKYPSIEYSGILVQSLRNNPVQLFNPFAPAPYGDGEANTVRSVITGRAEGLKLLAIRF